MSQHANSVKLVESVFLELKASELGAFGSMMTISRIMKMHICAAETASYDLIFTALLFPFSEGSLNSGQIVYELF